MIVILLIFISVIIGITTIVFFLFAISNSINNSISGVGSIFSSFTKIVKNPSYTQNQRKALIAIGCGIVLLITFLVVFGIYHSLVSFDYLSRDQSIDKYVKYPISSDGQILPNLQLKRGYIASTQIKYESMKYDINGKPEYSYQIEVQVTNNTQSPKGPNFDVIVWNSDMTKQETWDGVACSLSGDQQVSETKKFSGYYQVDFIPAYIAYVED